MAIDRENAKWPIALTPFPRPLWPWFVREMTRGPVMAWRSKEYLVQLYEERPGVLRLTVCTTEPEGDGWADGISWDTLQRLKREAGYGDRYAVEVYPADSSVVNVVNMRHLWLLDEAPPYAWTRGGFSGA